MTQDKNQPTIAVELTAEEIAACDWGMRETPGLGVASLTASEKLEAAYRQLTGSDLPDE